MAQPVFSETLIGTESREVRIEVHVGKGLPSFDIVGLPDRSIRESRIRVTAALRSSGFELPPRNLVINLAPGDLPKSGPGFDVAVAVAILASCGVVSDSALEEYLFLGELGLQGTLRSMRGILPRLMGARTRGRTKAIVPRGNMQEASLARGITCFAASGIRDILGHLDGSSPLEPIAICAGSTTASSKVCLRDVRGQPAAKRALTIAAAGRHALLIIGPPGAGKSMLAQRLPSIMPPLTEAEAFEVASIASIQGTLNLTSLGELTRPFRAPHNTASAAALIGGGDPLRPGEVTLAHRGVLFLDELPEFPRRATESLRATMQSGLAVLARARARITLPANPLIVAAMNPCPCGYAGDRTRLCTCSMQQVHKYLARISGPLVDRFDLHVVTARVPTRLLREAPAGPSSMDVQAQVTEANRRRIARGEQPPTDTLCSDALDLLEQSIDRLGLSARAFHKTANVARTIADLEGNEAIQASHIAEAIQYRVLDRHRNRGNS
ncbi:MAG: YifB family Mg chelatase-like AAA ATPase [Myxococcota bacterium]